MLDLRGARHFDAATITLLADGLAAGALEHLEKLGIMPSSFMGASRYSAAPGDAGMSALCHAFAHGALPKLQVLILCHCTIGDEGLSALAAAVAKGALPALQELYLHRNSFSEAGITELADVMAVGKLPALKKLVVDSHHEKHPALIAACQARGVEIA